MFSRTLTRTNGWQYVPLGVVGDVSPSTGQLGTEVSIKRLVIRPLAGVFELRGLVVKGDTSTTFATIDVLRCTTTGPLGTMSLAGPQTFSLDMHVSCDSAGYNEGMKIFAIVSCASDRGVKGLSHTVERRVATAAQPLCDGLETARGELRVSDRRRVLKNRAEGSL